MGRHRTGTVERRHDGTWTGRVVLEDGAKSPRFDLPDGNEKQARAYVAKVQAHEDLTGELYRAKLARVRKAGKAPASEETTDAWFARYVGGKACGASYRATSGHQWRKWVSPVIGAKPVGSLTRDDLELVRDELDAAIASGMLRTKTAANVWGLVTSAMCAAGNAKDRSLRVHVVPSGSPGLHAGILPPTRGESRRRPWLYPVEWSTLMASEAVPLVWRRVYAVALYTGLRPAELRVLTWGDVDLDARTVSVSKAWDEAARKVKAPKTSAGQRTFPLVGALVPLLETMHGEAGRHPGALVVPDLARAEERIAPKFRAHLRAAGVTRARLFAENGTEERADFRSCRDTFATWCALEGLATSSLQRRMGHESPVTTDAYVKQAEDVTRGAIGEPFPSLAILFGGDSARDSARDGAKGPLLPRFLRGVDGIRTHV